MKLQTIQVIDRDDCLEELIDIDNTPKTTAFLCPHCGRIHREAYKAELCCWKGDENEN